MKEDLKVKEVLTVYIIDKDGNIIKEETIKPPANKLEKIASKLGILKRANTINLTGLGVAAGRFIGVVGQDPIQYIGAYSDDDTQWDRENIVSTSTYNSNGDYIAWVKSDTFTSNATYSKIGAFYSDSDSTQCSEINLCLEMGSTDTDFWIELEFVFKDE